MTKPRKQHCWECRRRCLVCDSVKPACNRCTRAGVQCPGYGPAKPTNFRWLTPGAVLSRRPRRKREKASPAHSVADSSNSDDTYSDRDGVTRRALAMTPPRVVMAMISEPYHLPEAAEYFNTCIYPDLLPLLELGQNPHVYPLTRPMVQAAHKRPAYIQLGSVCVALSHRINRTRGTSESNALLIDKFYRYWGVAVASLNDHLGIEKRRNSDMVIAGMLTLLLADVQHGSPLNWRCHLEGVHKLIALRGGFPSLTAVDSLRPVLICFWYLAVIGNTTCPASDIAEADTHMDALDLIMSQYDTEASPFGLCPLPLFAEIIRINHLRARTAQCTDIAELEILLATAQDIRDRTRCFCPEEWACQKELSRDDWERSGRVWHAAVTLYCNMSLRDLFLNCSLQATVQTSFSADRSTHSWVLRDALQEALLSPRIKRFMIWPLVVLGVHAVHEDQATRSFVSTQLADLSRELGTYVPLRAKEVLETFWKSGRKDWDGCFDRPYVFTTQVLVNTGRLMPAED